MKVLAVGLFYSIVLSYSVKPTGRHRPWSFPVVYMNTVAVGLLYKNLKYESCRPRLIQPHREASAVVLLHTVQWWVCSTFSICVYIRPNVNGTSLQHFLKDIHALRVTEAFKWAYALRTELGDPSDPEITDIVNEVSSGIIYNTEGKPTCRLPRGATK